MQKQPKRKVKKRTILVWGIFISALLASLIAEFFIQMHPVFSLDGRRFFHAWFGLVICILMVLFSKFLGFFLKRQEGYYKENRND